VAGGKIIMEHKQGLDDATIPSMVVEFVGQILDVAGVRSGLVELLKPPASEGEGRGEAAA
jgi:hypothetical protein